MCKIKGVTLEVDGARRSVLHLREYDAGVLRAGFTEGGVA